MSKHTTLPMPVTGTTNSHVSRGTVRPWGNWNRHKKRRIPSRIRTVGRLARALRRIHLQATRSLNLVNHIAYPDQSNVRWDWVDHKNKILDAAVLRNEALFGNDWRTTREVQVQP